MEFKFDHVHLFCRDVDGMVDFFERIFGAERISYNPDFKGSASAVIRLGDMRIFVRGLRPGETPAAIAPMPEAETSFTQTRASGLICFKS